MRIVRAEASRRRNDGSGRTLPKPRDIAEGLSAAYIKLNIVCSIPDAADRVGPAAVQRPGDDRESESTMIRVRTREGMKVGSLKGRPRGQQPKLGRPQEAHLVELHRGRRDTTAAELAELFVAGSTVSRAVQRAGEPLLERKRDA